jgi:hypothetical protein
LGDLGILQIKIPSAVNFSSGDKCFYGPGFYERLEKIDPSIVYSQLRPNIVQNKEVYRIAYITFRDPKVVDALLYEGVGEFIENGVSWIYEKSFNNQYNENEFDKRKRF